MTDGGSDTPVDEVVTPDPPARSTSRQLWRWAAIVLVALLGGVIGSTVAGKAVVPTVIGDVELSVRPAPTGSLRLSAAPLGQVEAPVFRTPMAATVRLVALRNDFVVRAGQDLAAKKSVVTAEEADTAVQQINDGIWPLLVRILLGALVGGGLAVLVVFRSWRAMLAGAGVAVGVTAVFMVVSLSTTRDTMEGATTSGAIGVLPQANSDLVKNVEGIQDYAAKTFRNMEGLYSGYVRSAAANKLASSSERVVAVSGDPGDDEARRQVGVLASSQGAVAVIWISTGAPLGDGEPPAFPAAPVDLPVLFVAPGGPAAPTTALPSGVTTVGSGEARIGSLRIRILSGGSGTEGVAGPTGRSAPPLAVAATGVPVPQIDVPVVSTGTELSATGTGLTDSKDPARVTTGTTASSELRAAVMSLDDRRFALQQVELVTVADGDISTQRVLR